MTTGTPVADAVGQICSTAWHDVPDDELGAVLLDLERQVRRLEAARGAAAAEFACRQERAGRSLGSACERLAGRLGATAGEIRSRVESARRSGTPARESFEAGRMSAAQEKAVASAVDGLAESESDGVRAEFATRYTRAAENGTPAHAVSQQARSELAARYPVASLERERLQALRRSARCGRVSPDGMSTLVVDADPRLRALLDAVLARFGVPGSSITAGVDPETGEPAEPGSLAAADDRTPEQRAHDALAHALHLGLGASQNRAQGVASIVVRVTPEQLDAIDARRRAEESCDPEQVRAAVSAAAVAGELVVTDSGTDLSPAQALSLAGTNPWFVSALREGREELRRIDIDAGHASRRLASPIQRLVLYSVHQGCAFPGCHRSASRCQAHHLEEHSRGGPTTVCNLCLLCPIHHGWVGSGIERWRTLPVPGHPGTVRWIPPGTPTPPHRARRTAAA